MKRPRFQRDNPKVRKVLAPPNGTDLAQVAESCRYVGSPYHKDALGFAGMPRGRRPTASLCPTNLVNCRDLIEGWLRDAVRSGRVGAWDGRFPRYVWHSEDDVIFEARQGSPRSGEYHGYPFEPTQRVQGLE